MERTYRSLSFDREMVPRVEIDCTLKTFPCRLRRLNADAIPLGGSARRIAKGPAPFRRLSRWLRGVPRRFSVNHRSLRYERRKLTARLCLSMIYVHGVRRRSTLFQGILFPVCSWTCCLNPRRASRDEWQLPPLCGAEWEPATLAG